MINWNKKQYHCPVEVSMQLLSGKWKCLMLWHLNEGTKRYNELERIVPGVSQKMLTQQLKELEKDGLISRTVYPEVPPRVEYSLTELGQSAFPILEMITHGLSNNWGLLNPNHRLQGEILRGSKSPRIKVFPDQFIRNHA